MIILSTGFDMDETRSRIVSDLTDVLLRDFDDDDVDTVKLADIMMDYYIYHHTRS